MSVYSERHYSGKDQKTRHAADAVLSIILPLLPPVRSAVDVGCGAGTWLSVLQSRGIQDIQGIDGPWVNVEELVIPASSFCNSDLSEKFTPLSRRYDLAMCLEVAEHLPQSRAQDLARWLTELSDVVLFAAAVPFQGGRHHVNEQWQHYWAALFAESGYEAFDPVRPEIWEDQEIPVWYRQNTLLYVRKGSEAAATLGQLRGRALPLDVVHPHMFESRMNRDPGVRASLRMLSTALTRRATRR